MSISGIAFKLGRFQYSPWFTSLLRNPSGWLENGVAFDFINGWYDMLGDTGVSSRGNINDFLTYSSPSTKYVMNDSGVYVPGTTMRCDHLADGTALGLLIEGQRTNFFLKARYLDYSATYHTLTDHPTLKNVFGNPAKIDTFYNAASGSTGLALGSVTNFAAGETVVAEIELAAGADTSAAFGIYHQDGGLGFGANGDSTAAVISGPGVLSQSVGSMWAVTGLSAVELTRVRITMTLPGGATTGTADTILYPRTSASHVDAQVVFALRNCEKGAAPSSPIATEGSQVTRAADNISLATSLFPFDATKGTLLAKVVPGNIGSGVWVLARLRQDGTNFITLVQNTAAKQGQVNVGGVTQVALSSGSAVVGTAYKSAFSWKANDFGFSSNGGVIQTDPTGSLPTPTTLYFGSANGSSGHFEGWLQQLIYLPRDMSDAELVAWSAL